MSADATGRPGGACHRRRLRLGRATALALAEAGAALTVADIDEPAGRETVRLIEAGGGRGGFVRTDVTQWDDLQRAVDFTVETFGGLHVFHNNAGINTGWPDFPHSPRGRWEKFVAVNLWAVIAGIQLAYRRYGKAAAAPSSTWLRSPGLRPTGPTRSTERRSMVSSVSRARSAG